jgi:acetyltransferase-like isoleucine patch superfamily enzyme
MLYYFLLVSLTFVKKLLSHFYPFLLHGYPRLSLGKCCSFNGLPYIRIGKKSSISIGNNFTGNSSKIFNPVGQASHLSLIAISGGSIKIGNDVGLTGVNIVSAVNIEIGNSTLIGSGTCIWDTNFHPSDPSTRKKLKNDLSGGSIKIGKNVFIGCNALILKNVTIGNDCTIAAGAVVSKCVPDNCLAYGNPMIIKPYSSPFKS